MVVVLLFVSASPRQNRFLTKRNKWIKCVFTVLHAAGEQIVRRTLGRGPRP